jgi:hypothetical protein
MDNNYISRVMLKPDAFATFIPRRICTSLFHAFANHICPSETASLKGDMLICESNAKMQVYERAKTESKFRGDICFNSQAKAKFISAIESFEGDNLLAADVIQLGIVSLGYNIIRRKNYCLLPQDVTFIYGLDDYESKLTNLSNSLHDYLDWKNIVLLKLSSCYGDFLMQHWKTYVRHFLIINRTEQFPLINLIHVCEDEYQYIDSLLDK